MKIQKTKIQKDQNSEVKKLYEDQASKPSRTSTPKSENIRSRIIQTIFLDPKVCGNQAQRSKNIIKSQISEALRIQASKAPKNFHHKSTNTKNIRSRIIQTTCLDLKGHWNQAQKPPETLNNHKSVKLHGFKPLKPQRTSTTNLWRRRTWRTWRTNDFQQAHSQRFIVILFQRSLIHSSAKLKYIGCSNWNHITTNPINKSFKEIESEDHSFVITENCTTQSLIQIRICETIFTCLTHFETRNLVAYKFLHAQWDISAFHLILLQWKKSSSSCCLLQWPLARTFKLQQ